MSVPKLSTPLFLSLRLVLSSTHLEASLIHSLTRKPWAAASSWDLVQSLEHHRIFSDPHHLPRNTAVKVATLLAHRVRQAQEVISILSRRTRETRKEDGRVGTIGRIGAGAKATGAASGVVDYPLHVNVSALAKGPEFAYYQDKSYNGELMPKETSIQDVMKWLQEVELTRANTETVIHSQSPGDLKQQQQQQQRYHHQHHHSPPSLQLPDDLSSSCSSSTCLPPVCFQAVVNLNLEPSFSDMHLAVCNFLATLVHHGLHVKVHRGVYAAQQGMGGKKKMSNVWQIFRVMQVAGVEIVDVDEEQVLRWAVVSASRPKGNDAMRSKPDKDGDGQEQEIHESHELQELNKSKIWGYEQVLQPDVEQVEDTTQQISQIQDRVDILHASEDLEEWEVVEFDPSEFHFHEQNGSKHETDPRPTDYIKSEQG